VKSWPTYLLLCCVAFGHAHIHAESSLEEGIDLELEGWETAVPLDPNAPPVNWADTSHAYATEQAQSLTRWMDSFFGEPNADLDEPESVVRLQWTNTWDQDDGYNTNLRLRGKIQLPALSKRLNLVFSGEEGDELNLDDNENRLDDQVGLLYEVTESKRSRFDLTMGITINHLRPGARYRFQDTLGESSGYRLTQRVQYENDQGFYATSQAEIDRALTDNQFLRWNNRAVYGEETDGTEWTTRVSFFQRLAEQRRRQLGINYFAAINGETDPKSYVKNYRVGVLFRSQLYRKYLFVEVEPAYNYRKRDPDDKRQFAWSIGLRFEIALAKDLQRVKSRHIEEGDGELDGDGNNDL
jgi:hypothetical protein